MATKGYSSYHGRSPLWKKILIVVLVLLLLGAGAFLYCQNHLVYDESGKVHLDLPFLREEAQQEPTEQEKAAEDVELEREEPQAPTIETLRAEELANTALENDVSSIVSGTSEALVINVKLADGGYTYQPVFTVESGTQVGSAVATENLKKLLASGKYTVARVSALCDTTYASQHMEDCALLRTWDQWLWYDYDGRCWLDLSKPATQTYLKQVCKDLADLGFKEILLDNFGWPSYGNLDAVLVADGTDKAAIITNFLTSLREELPSATAVSVAISHDNPTYSGLTAAVLANFDRIYVDSTTVDDEALVKTLPETFTRDTQLVLMVREAQTSGSYMVVQ